MKSWIEDRPEVRVFTDLEAVWLAAVIDGEGSFGLYDYGREGRRVMIQMANTSEPFVVRMREIIGCGSQVTRTGLHLSGRLNGHQGRQPMYQYCLKGSQRCYKVLRQIEPHLIIKRQRAREILAELEAKPFGRWANGTDGARASAGEKKRAWWAALTPERRAEVVANMVAGRAR